jgi:hypothetical protein
MPYPFGGLVGSKRETLNVPKIVSRVGTDDETRLGLILNASSVAKGSAKGASIGRYS